MIRPRRIKWAECVVPIRDKTNAYSVLVGKSGGKGPLGRPRRRCVGIINVDLGEIR
jgi:hypothetical protein